MKNNLFHTISKNIQENRTFALVTVISVSGSTPSKPGFRMVVYSDSTSEGTVGGGQLENISIKRSVEMLEQKKKSELNTYKLDQDLNMACGGKIDVLFETFDKPTLHLIGAGHVAQAIAPLALNCDFAVKIYDDRKDYLELAELPVSVDKYAGKITEIINDIPSDMGDYFVVLTYDHKLDRQAVHSLMQKPKFSYLGVIGSKNKAVKIKIYLKNQGIEQSKIEKLRTPVGLPIGAETPAEIAVSIVGDLIACRAGKTLPTW
ncbi:MAG: XdhC family protein [Deltaproteobacteria bacterium]|nr:XdhC family protein [Deltaproteobacteria bacterium]